jgi:O-antigen ligase
LSEKQKILITYLITFIYLAVNIALIINNFYWFLLLPVAAVVIYYYFFKLDNIILLITFCTPLAITLKLSQAGLSLSIPTEPMMFGVLLIFFFKLLYDSSYDNRVFKHPVTICILLNLVWIFITSMTSQLPLISFKFLLARLWFIIPFYFVAVVMFKDQKTIKKFSWFYIVPFLAVIIYATVSLYTWGFEEKAAHWVMTPFYNDHTAYGAALSFFIPIVLGYLFDKGYLKSTKFFILLALIVLLTGLILSYSRAAWISLIVALVFALILIYKIKLKWLVLGALALLALFYVNSSEIFWKLEKNKQDSSTNIAEHVQSISNITTDASNLERLNRWNSALRLFKEHPFWGIGPGTYQFLYAPYQHSREKTIISTNAGDRGNAHSEYIGPLTEQGIIGLISILSIFITIIYTGIKVYKRSRDKQVKLLSVVFLSGLITYMVHGFLNNFLDTDKASVPFWGFAAVIVALDIYHRTKTEA